MNIPLSSLLALLLNILVIGVAFAYSLEIGVITTGVIIRIEILNQHVSTSLRKVINVLYIIERAVTRSKKG